MGSGDGGGKDGGKNVRGKIAQKKAKGRTGADCGTTGGRDHRTTGLRDDKATGPERPGVVT